MRDGVIVIEDACSRARRSPRRRRVGGPGGADMTTFSLHPVKAMTTGEGGIVTTENDELAARLRRFAPMGSPARTCTRRRRRAAGTTRCSELGFNYRMTDFQCALGLSQLRHLDEWISPQRGRWLVSGAAGRRASRGAAAAGAARLTSRISPLRGPRPRRPDRRPTCSRATRGGHRRSAPLHPDLPLQLLPRHLGYPAGQLPAAEEYYASAISLPMFPALSRTDVERVVTELRRLLD